MTHVFRVGTRKSRLALRQTELIIDALRERHPECEFIVRPIVTQGDRDLNSSLQKIGGKGVFVKEIERELLDGTIDFAAHSLKDVQPVLPESLTLGCFPKRDSPFDCLISARPFSGIDDLPQGARIGTNSLRRQAQILRLRPDIVIVPIRGNVETRLHKIETEHLDGVILAEAGLNRLRPDLSGYHRLSLRDVILPAAGQGAMTVECRADDADTLTMLASVDDDATRAAVHAEREFMTALGGSCTFPIGAYARYESNQLTFDGLVASADGRHCFTRHLTGTAADHLGKQAAESLISAGALTYLQ
ncbi:hydroxymethylbilane synthase [Bifidobacterium sp. 82T24]|uniref:Porphobilinogen deaminase n=1 Tax=Bifidobacterium saimiriisciurei TaxID=2661627 RepID=A0ABX0CA70_9BIFI|nr:MULTISPECIES: hydroxymethylbilane synthase [Bifidobacterium]MBW3088377.1 hydroxymethylbilane synthase [Bifidobacterium pluvialisilvae]NEG96995.1 hydroxymethylbilane synthase [Bifidobacterium sp. SMB2]NEH12022.1 hydroxymethylbilane synthase [Bifidobacterium saimiriisciurei]